MMPHHRGFPDLLRRHRRANGLTQEQLAKLWSYSTEAISAWERGIRSPNSQEIPRLASLLEVEPQELVEMIHAGIGKAHQDELIVVGVGKGEGMDEQRLSEMGSEREIANVFRDRTALEQHFSYPHMFETAQEILAVGISLNAIALHYSREAFMRAVMQNQSSFTLCLLDPDGAKCAEREQEENLPKGALANLIRLNLASLQGIRGEIARKDAESAGRLKILTYDLLPRFNSYLFDGTLMTMQFYAYGRGQDTPCFILKRQSEDGLFEYFASAARYVLAQSTPRESLA